MSTQAAQATTSASSGQAVAAAAAASSSTSGQSSGGTAETTTTTETKATPSILGGAASTQNGGQSTQGAESKDGTARAAELEIKLPEGVKVDEALLAEFKALATKQKLTSEQASELATFQSAQRAKEAKAQTDAWEAQKLEWRKTIEADKEYGGANLKATEQAAQKALARFGDPDLANFIEQSGLGNHPGLVRWMAKVGKALAEDNSATAGRHGQAASDEHDQLRKRYPSMYHEDGSPKF